MEQVLDYLQKLNLHPVADHFTIGLLTIAILIDLVASLFPMRTWMRYTALTLVILGALAAGASFGTGDMEADRIWKALGPEAKGVLGGRFGHAALGEYLAIVFGVLALWRILIEAFEFASGSRGIYLIVAVVAVVALLYQGHLGAKLVYDYGAGTALMAAQPVPTEAAPSAAPTPSGIAPTVSVPTSTPTAVPTAAPLPTAPPAAAASPAASPSAPAAATPAATAPSAAPTSAGV
jgi:uncharacterized membrane protein